VSAADGALVIPRARIRLRNGGRLVATDVRVEGPWITLTGAPEGKPVRRRIYSAESVLEVRELLPGEER